MVRLSLHGLHEGLGRAEGLVGASERVLVGADALRPPLRDHVVEDDQVDEEVLVKELQQKFDQLLGVLDLRACHRLADVQEDEDVHRDTFHLRDGRRSVVEVSKVAVLGDQLRSAADVDVVVQLHVAGEPVVAKLVELV